MYQNVDVSSLTDGLVFGCDYNPEQWDPATWREDVALMREAGVNLVAVNIFGWSHVEPREGEFDFSDLDEVVALLHENGIRVNLGTATASPPPWLTARYPEVLPMVEDGTRRYPGGRQAFCPSSPTFRRYALRLVEEVARRYGDHPALAVWHVSNELGCHNALCYDDSCAAAFRRWLERRYGTVEALNAAWGTAFWSQRYGEWSEILPPRATLSIRNPAHVLDFHRFSSDQLLDHYRAEAEVIRRHSSAPVTTNFMVTAHIRNMDYWTWAPEMDLVANDHYLDHRLAAPTAELAFAADLTRGLAQGRPWLLMESSVGAVNWQPHNLAKGPGEAVRNAVTQIARGADGICYFQWRASRQGAEKYHSALLPHAGTDSTTWRTTLDVSRAVRALAEVRGTRVQAQAALVFSWESWWAAEGEARPTQEVDYLQQVHHLYGAARALGLTVDVVAPGQSLEGYRFLLVPSLHLVRDADARVVDEWVQAGGHAWIGFNSGIVDERDAVRLGGYPGAFRETVSARSDEFLPLAPSQTVRLSDGSTASLWTERLEPVAAQTVLSYTDGPAAGHAAVTRHARGSGVAWYCSTHLEPAALREQLGAAVADAGLAASAGDDELELIRRTGPSGSFLFAVNHGGAERQVPVSGTELLTGATIDHLLEVPAGGVRVVKEHES